MSDKVVPFERAKQKGKKDIMETLLNIDAEISDIPDPEARQALRDALKKVAFKLFSSPFPG